MRQKRFCAMLKCPRIPAQDSELCDYHRSILEQERAEFQASKARAGARRKQADAKRKPKAKPKTCSTDDCNRPVFSSGLCKTCYGRQYRAAEAAATIKRLERKLADQANTITGLEVERATLEQQVDEQAATLAELTDEVTILRATRRHPRLDEFRDLQARLDFAQDALKRYELRFGMLNADNETPQPPTDPQVRPPAR